MVMKKKLTYKFIVTLIALMISSSSISAENTDFVCIADNRFTSEEFRGKQFSLILSSTCLKLTNLQNKNDIWSWKIFLKNSSGDVEGSRHFCDNKDAGLIGGPAIFRMSKMTLIIFGEIGFNASFSCQALNPK